MAPLSMAPLFLFASTWGRGGRVVKAFDSKSNGVSQHRFESCPRRNILIDLTDLDWNLIWHMDIHEVSPLKTKILIFTWYEITFAITSSYTCTTEMCDGIVHRTWKERKVHFGALFSSWVYLNALWVNFPAIDWCQFFFRKREMWFCNSFIPGTDPRLLLGRGADHTYIFFLIFWKKIWN